MGRCIGVIVLGTAESRFNDKERKNEIMLRFELPQLHFKGTEPRVVWDTYTWSMGPKSNLRKLLNVWCGRTLTDVQADTLDFEKLLGRPVYVTIIHKDGNNGSYAKIASVSRAPNDGEGWPKQIMPSVLFNVGNFHDAELQLLPKSVLERVMKSDEFQQRNGAPGGQAGEFAPAAPLPREAQF